ncbi:hypothetical protein OIDMADRAFT_125496 [Oidiodendron maius Zn]|uniref:ABC transporter n=1 Tax=Oidiodendron maius (strain Zn) TaxID=913774 RepID=A0A0C3HB32_OIDMZ|nr:hypothetical protein OIDMADRAFT_125496 [Oidiodendron maius Zn]
MQTVILILHALTRVLRTRATLVAATLSVLDGLALCFLSHSEHNHSIRPSTIINAYLLLTLPFDAARARTLWLGRATRPVAAAFTSALGIKLIILITEAMEKRSILLDRYRHTSPEATIGWGLTAAFGIVFIGLAVANGSYYHMTYRFVTSVRGTLVSMIYAKTIDLSITALDESAAVTLMASDTETICQGFTTLHEFWAVPIELGIALYLLHMQLGLAFLATAVVTLFSTTGILIMAKYMGNAQKIWIEGIQTRVDVSASMLSSMKGIKMLGFTNIMSNIVQANFTQTFAPLATFAVFVVSARITGQKLDAATSFTALSLISLIASPMNILIAAIPQINSAMACFERIQSFLNSGTRMDHRLPLENADVSSLDQQTSASNSGVELRDLSPLLGPGEISPIMIIRNASFGWNSGGRPDVSDINLTLLQRQFCFIIGPVGSGKSTLLKGILGETPSTQGFVYSSSQSIAYNDQTPWIQNATIQQNILGVSSFDESWYSQVIRACALEFDISKLPKGHATPVGSAGISLSGGQKQRVALARAVYARKTFILLDDVFSGLDAETEDQVFNRLFGGEGLLRRMGTTVLLATHAVHRLPFSDHIIALDSFGHVIEQGHFEQLKTSGGYVENITTKLRDSDDSSEKKPQEAAKLDTSAFKATADEHDAHAEELNRQSGDFSVYKYYFASMRWRHVLMFFVFAVLVGVTTKMPEILLTYWTSAVAIRGNVVNGFYLGMFALLSGLATLTLTLTVIVLALYMVPKSAEVLHERLLKTVMAAPLSFFTSTDVGTTTNSQDMTVIDAELPYSLVDLSLSTVMAIMGAILMCLSAGYFAATLPPVILAVWILQKYYLRTSRQLRLLDLEAKSPLYSNFIESLSGLATIRAFGWTEHFKELNLKLLDVSQKPYYLLFCIQRWLGLLLDLMVAILGVILMVLVVKLRTDVSGGFVGLALLNVTTFNSALAQIIKNWTLLETSFGAIARLKSFSAHTASENLPREIETPPDNWPTRGAIEFAKVSASYSVDSDLVLRNFAMSIKPGEKIGICGRSGSGKSSLVSTLFRMLEITDDSSITIDGVDITTIPRQLVRERLNAIPQEPIFITGNKGGLDADLDAEFFSHGQRQLFCLARAILRKSKVVILDEATSSVDTKSDELMQKVIRSEFNDCTIIAVAHRLDTILDFDRIALLSGGELLEFDTPKALLGRPSAFRELYNS